MFVFFSSCGCCEEKQKDLTYTHDFESLQGWTNHPYGLEKGIAHSGDFSCKTDTLARYSYNFQLDLNTISKRPLGKVSAILWALKSNESATGDLIIEITDKDGKNLCWASYPLTSAAAGAHEWIEIEGFADLSKKGLNDPANKINIVFVNSGKARIDVDDFEIKFENL